MVTLTCSSRTHFAGPLERPRGGVGDGRSDRRLAGQVENLAITTTGSSTVSGWSLVFTLPSGRTITGGWSAAYSPTSGTVTATNVSCNGTPVPGASTSIAFQATHTGAPAPASTLNGTSCTAS